EECARGVAGDAAVAADAQRDAPGDALQLVRQQRCIGGDHHDDRAVLGVEGRIEGVGILALDLAPDRNAGDAQVGAQAVVALDQYAERVAAVLVSELPRGGADPALEAVADHAGAAANHAFLHGPRARSVERLEHVLGLDVEAVDVVQPAVPGLGHHRQRPPGPGLVLLTLLHAPGDDRIAHHAHAVSVGDHHRAFEEPGLVHPGGTGHLAVAVLRIP